MSKALIIAEKPSVASDLARALGGFKKVDDISRTIATSFPRPSAIWSSSVCRPSST